MFFRILFLIGITFFLVGQALLARGLEWVYAQQPIDFAHWSLFIGAMCMLPQITRFPKSVFTYLGAPLSYIGLCLMLGMCVLDFIWWSYSGTEERIAFTNHIANIPSIWKPFITIGPSTKVFNLGLLLLSLNYWNSSKLGIALVLLSCLVLWGAIPVPMRMVFGYLFAVLGFLFIFIPNLISARPKKNIT